MNQLTFTISASLAFAASSLVTCVLHAQDANATQKARNPNDIVESSSATQQPNNSNRTLEAMKSDAETNYIASPYNVTQLGLRSYWQTKIPHQGTSQFAGMTIEDDEIFAWDHAGVLTRLNTDTGAYLWQVSTQSALDKIYSITILPAGITRAAVALTDAATVVFEEGNGGLLAQAPLRRVPATSGVACGNYMVFGDTEGRVIWLELHESNITNTVAPNSAPNQYAPSQAATQRRTAICVERFGGLSRGKVVTVPVVVPRFGVLTVSTGGDISLFDAKTSKPIWKYKSNAPFVSKPSVLDDIAYVVGKDQYVHAISMKSGKSIWNWFTQVPLTNAPLAAGNLVALQVPEEGLVALSTTPGDKVSGLVLWKSKAAGNPITLTKEGLITWDEPSRTMTLVETTAGGITATATFPNARFVASTGPIDGTIMLLSNDGSMQQLRPIQMMKPVMPSKATGEVPEKPTDVDGGEKAAEPGEEPAAVNADASESAP